MGHRCETLFESPLNGSFVASPKNLLARGRAESLANLKNLEKRGAILAGVSDLTSFDALSVYKR